MKRYLKKSLALFLALMMAVSTMSVMAMASGYTEGSAGEPEQAEDNSDYNGEPDDTTGGPSSTGDEEKTDDNYDESDGDDGEEVVLTVYVQPESSEVRPGDTVDVDYTIGPVAGLRRFSFQVSEPEGLLFERLLRHGTDLTYLMDLMFNGDGEISNSGTKIQGYGYYDVAFTSDDDFYMFSARYIVPDNVNETEITFGFESAEVTIANADEVKINVVAEPLQITKQRNGICGDNLTWLFDGNDTLTISGTGDMYDYYQMGAPWSDIEEIQSVIVEDGVTSIGNNAFYSCSGLESIVISDSVISIGNNALYSCNSLESIALPDGLISIGNNAFYFCSSLTSITIPDSVTSIGSNAFSYCSNLKEIIFLGDAPKIDSYIFYSVTATAYCPEGNITWTSSVMQNCGGNITWIGGDPDTMDRGICGDNLIWVLNSEGTLTISGTGDMYDYEPTYGEPWEAYERYFITSVVIEDGVTSIGDYAFDNCRSMTSVTIPEGITRIGGWAFEICWSLTKISIPASVTCIDQGAFIGCQLLSEITLGSHLESIGDYAFEQCNSLKSITIPASVTSIGQYAFMQCPNLMNIYFEGNAPELGIYCFQLVDATVYYPHGNSTWVPEIMRNYGGTITWKTEDHIWGNVTWKWSDDYKSATATHTCTICGAEESVKATISSDTIRPTAQDNGETTYTAVAVFADGTTASDTVTQILPATGTPNTVKNGFAQDGNNWYYYVNDKVDTSCNDVLEGIVNGTSGWWYVEGGQVQLKYTGVANHANSNGWWYIENGKVNFNKTGVEQNNYGWWRIVNGKVDFSCNSVEQNDYGWWYVVGGQVQFGYTGVADFANAYGWWYISGGKVDFSRNSVEQNAYGWWYVTGGKVDFGYTGVANYANDFGWWYISGGQVDFNKTSVEPNAYGWWRVENGKVNFSFTGWASNSYGTWYCVNGKVDFSRN